MTNEQITEEILNEAYKMGIQKEVFRVAQEKMILGMPMYKAYEEAFLEVVDRERKNV